MASDGHRAALTAIAGAYEGLAVEVYDHDTVIGRSFGDVEFYRGRPANVAGPVLEPACGSRRMMVPLLEAIHQVAGSDASATCAISAGATES